MRSESFRATCTQLGWRRVSAELAALGVTVSLLIVLTYWSVRLLTPVLDRWVWPLVPNFFASPFSALAWGGAVIVFIPFCYVGGVLLPLWGIIGLLHLLYAWLGWKKPQPVVGEYY